MNVRRGLRRLSLVLAIGYYAIGGTFIYFDWDAVRSAQRHELSDCLSAGPMPNHMDGNGNPIEIPGDPPPGRPRKRNAARFIPHRSLPRQILKPGYCSLFSQQSCTGSGKFSHGSPVGLNPSDEGNHSSSTRSPSTVMTLIGFLSWPYIVAGPRRDSIHSNTLFIGLMTVFKCTVLSSRYESQGAVAERLGIRLPDA
jgi:hypothetical protein